MGIVKNMVSLAANLDNRKQQGVRKDEEMKRIKDKVKVNGKIFWIDGYSNQELYDNYVRLLEREGLVKRLGQNDITLLGEYVENYYDTYKVGQEKNTIVNRKRIIKNHIIPKFGDRRIETITPVDIQKWFNELAEKYSRETILKIKNTLSPAMDSAVEDGLITMNPLKSRRIEIRGKDVVHHKAIPRDIMKRIKADLPGLPAQLRFMAGLLCYTGMRFEEILGLRAEDISKTSNTIAISRAVVHPDRNQPVIKCTKTASSDRIIPCSEKLMSVLYDIPSKGFVLASPKDPSGETPLSYSEARRLYKKFQEIMDIPQYTPHDFRDTCATEWRENGMDLDVIARMLGHSKTETTEKRYVKYREDIFEEAKKLM